MRQQIYQMKFEEVIQCLYNMYTSFERLFSRRAEYETKNKFMGLESFYTEFAEATKYVNVTYESVLEVTSDSTMESLVTTYLNYF